MNRLELLNTHYQFRLFRLIVHHTHALLIP
nr:MAG TPA: hypothetical protein [Caudoviricetes sp.]